MDCPLFSMVRHMDPILIVFAVALVTKMIKEGERGATDYCLIHVWERTSFMPPSAAFYFKIIGLK